jgi:hypothetical protein
MSDETNPKRQRGQSGKTGQTERSPSLALLKLRSSVAKRRQQIAAGTSPQRFKEKDS